MSVCQDGSILQGYFYHSAPSVFSSVSPATFTKPLKTVKREKVEM